MATKLFDASIIGTAEAAVDFITNVLQASTECSIIGKALDGTIVLWNEGARQRRRKNGQRFSARVVITPQRGATRGSGRSASRWFRRTSPSSNPTSTR